MFDCGVIEGFYGRPWSWQQRHAMLDFLAANGFSQYCYAPKADACLRKHWQQDWPAGVKKQLLQLAEHARRQGLAFGIGLSPLSLLQDWPAQKPALLQKLASLASLQPELLLLLFDDTRGDMPQLAERQCDIAAVVAAALPATRLMLCPTYYSFDPLLPELFGAMPAHYWEDLGRLLDPAINVLWTGRQVISEQHDAADLEDISRRLQRAPVIWDNSRVSDGRNTSPFLPLQAMFTLADLQPHCRGLLVNPMNPPALARIVLKTLMLPGSDEQRLADALQQEAGDLADVIQQSLPLLRDKGLDALDDEQRQCLQACFAGSSHPAAQDICRWLAGEFRFDPACLT